MIEYSKIVYTSNGQTFGEKTDSRPNRSIICFDVSKHTQNVFHCRPCSTQTCDKTVSYNLLRFTTFSKYKSGSFKKQFVWDAQRCSPLIKMPISIWL